MRGMICIFHVYGGREGPMGDGTLLAYSLFRPICRGFFADFDWLAFLILC